MAQVEVTPHLGIWSPDLIAVICCSVACLTVCLRLGCGHCPEAVLRSVSILKRG